MAAKKVLTPGKVGLQSKVMNSFLGNVRKVDHNNPIHGLLKDTAGFAASYRPITVGQFLSDVTYRMLSFVGSNSEVERSVMSKTY